MRSLHNFSLNYTLVSFYKNFYYLELNSNCEVDYMEMKLVIDGKEIPLNEFDNPIVQSGRPFGEEAIAWMILSSDSPAVRPPELLTFIEKDVQPILERVEGVSSVRVFGGFLEMLVCPAASKQKSAPTAASEIAVLRIWGGN